MDSENGYDEYEEDETLVQWQLPTKTTKLPIASTLQREWIAEQVILFKQHCTLLKRHLKNVIFAHRSIDLA